MLEKDIKMIVEIKKGDPETVSIKPVDDESFNVAQFAYALMASAVALLESLPEEVASEIVSEVLDV